MLRWAGTYRSERGIQWPMTKAVLQKDIKFLLDKPRNHNPVNGFRHSQKYKPALSLKTNDPIHFQKGKYRRDWPKQDICILKLNSFLINMRNIIHKLSQTYSHTLSNACLNLAIKTAPTSRWKQSLSGRKTIYSRDRLLMHLPTF